ncbi:MAG TPA: hypothetical protein PLY86_18300 [bacterium]|nr:hypothetical protein [bacterium]
MNKASLSKVVTHVEFDARYIFVPLSRNLLPLRRWELDVGPEEKPLYRSRFHLADLPISSLFLCAPQESTFRSSDAEIFLNDEQIKVWDSTQEGNCVLLWADVTHTAQPGQNEIRIRTNEAPMRFRIEGDFIVRQFGGDEVLFPPPDHLYIGSWTIQGYPYFRGAAAYRQSVTIPETMRYRRFFLKFESVGNAVEVRVNGKSVRAMSSPPWETEVTQAVQFGKNRFEFVVSNSHPGGFDVSPGPSGLLGPVVLEAR